MSLAWSSVKALSIPVGGVSRDVKRVTAGGVTLWEKAPAVPYDAEVEYIESTGTQYIDTGIACTSDIDYEIRVYEDSPTGRLIFGARDVGINTNQLAVQTQSNPVGNIYFRYNNAAGGSRIMQPATWTALKCVNGSAYVDGDMVHSFTPAQFSAAGQTLYICAINGFDVQGSNALRVAFCRIWRNGVLVRDYIPVRVGSGANAVGCLYDRANPTGGPSGNGLYGNSGSGAFDVGPNKSP